MLVGSENCCRIESQHGDGGGDSSGLSEGSGVCGCLTRGGDGYGGLIAAGSGGV